MSKYTSRINRLIIKTHNYFSFADHCLVRDYFKAIFDESEKPADFDERYKEFLELEKEYKATKDEEIKAKFMEIMKDSYAIRYRYMYDNAIKICERFPNGDLQPKTFTDKYRKTISEARNYFKNKQSE